MDLANMNLMDGRRRGRSRSSLDRVVLGCDGVPNVKNDNAKSSSGAEIWGNTTCMRGVIKG